MELAKLNSQFRRETPIENWSSLIWTERYSSNGDFELVSSSISEIMSLLPCGELDPPCLVAIGESDVPMIVETHKIVKNKKGVPEIVTQGRTFETVLDRRQAVRAITSGVARIEWNIEAVNAAVAAHAAIKAIVIDGVATPLDIIPEMILLNGVTDSGVTQKFPVEPKELYSWVIDTLALGQYGLRSSLPISGNQIAVTIYKGKDRRTPSVEGDAIVFEMALDQIDEATYLISSVGSKNTMITTTTNGMEVSSLGTPKSGLQRRVGYQDVSSDVTLVPGADLTQLTINKGKVALADLLPTALFSGGVAAEIASGYNDSYFLGDIVKLSGEYGLSQEARIAEFVRTHDNTGVKSYPTFQAVVA